MSDIRDVWRRSHGYTEEQLHRYAADLEWLLEDPRFQGSDFTPPESVTKFLKLAQMMEAEVIRLMSAGPPYEPRTDLDGAFGIAHIHAFFPPKWIEFLTSLGLPESAITTDMAKEWEPLLEKGVPLVNGNMLSNHAWAVSDPAWSLLFPSYLALLLDPSIKAPWGNDPAWIKVDDADQLSFALVGDWSTGTWTDGDAPVCPPDAVMREIEKFGVDYTVHLGDVYPLGSTQFYGSFLEGWKPGRRGAFNFNGNHDMYGWARGYFESLTHPTFATQQGTSYFAVELGGWIVVGLDTSYFDDSMLVGTGSVRDPDQTAFLGRVREQVNETGQRIFMLTHHLALNQAGTRTTSVWDDVVSDGALGKPPDVWYYGHYHAAAVYSADSVVGKTTKARVMGHGALPFAPPEELAQNAGPGKPIECYAHTPYDDDDPMRRGRAMNGFAHVTLTEDGGITERFLNQDGSDICR